MADATGALGLLIIFWFLIRRNLTSSNDPPPTTSINNQPVDTSPPSIISTYPPVSIPPVTTNPPQAWWNQAQDYKNQNSQKYKFPVVGYYFPTIRTINEQIQEELSNNQLPTKKQAIEYGILVGFETAGIDSKSDLVDHMIGSMQHLKSDISNGKMTHKLP